MLGGIHTLPYSFIEENYLKKFEVIEKVEEIDSLLIFTVVKQTARTYKKVAQYKISSSPNQVTTIPPKLMKYKLTPKAKRKIDESNETIQQWLKQGFIVREIRFHQDGLSVMEDHFRMGPTFTYVMNLQQQINEEKHEQWLEEMKLKASEFMLPQPFENIMDIDRLPQNWQIKKRRKFIEFCLAFNKISQQKDLFDYKEIGATWHEEIGGSKYFDIERKDFLNYLEQSNIDTSLYGLVSMGKITPVFFTGNVQNEYAQYKIGVIHATTDSAVLNSTFTTTNTIMWLVENRAILTRMAIEREFLKQSNSCVICLDGQIRSVHKHFIEQLQKCSIQQTIIWTDTDPAGRTIAKHAASLAKGPIKIIGRNFEVFHSIEDYEKHEQDSHEQEQQLGGVTEWSNWI